jgi:hypothetical protein
MAVAAGVIAVEPVITGSAIIDLAVQSVCAAADNIVQRFFVAGEHAVAILRLIGRTVFPDDVGEFEHGWKLDTRNWKLIRGSASGH